MNPTRVWQKVRLSRTAIPDMITEFRDSEHLWNKKKCEEMGIFSTYLVHSWDSLLINVMFRIPKRPWFWWYLLESTKCLPFYSEMKLLHCFLQGKIHHFASCYAAWNKHSRFMEPYNPTRPTICCATSTLWAMRLHIIKQTATHSVASTVCSVQSTLVPHNARFLTAEY